MFKVFEVCQFVIRFGLLFTCSSMFETQIMLVIVVNCVYRSITVEPVLRFVRSVWFVCMLVELSCVFLFGSSISSGDYLVVVVYKSITLDHVGDLFICYLVIHMSSMCICLFHLQNVSHCFGPIGPTFGLPCKRTNHWTICETRFMLLIVL